MSDADNACREWIAERTGIAQSQRGIAISQAAFMAGYRRALEDAAKDCVDNWEPVYYEGKNAEWPNDTTAQWLRDRASSVGTKDGASDHE